MVRRSSPRTFADACSLRSISSVSCRLYAGMGWSSFCFRITGKSVYRNLHCVRKMPGRRNSLNATFINWNVRWARPRTPIGTEILRRLTILNPQVICLTEGHTDFLLPKGGHLIASSADYGYRAQATCRKVLLWSKQPWCDVDEIGSAELPTGRFIAGSTMTDAGLNRCVGVCIPWRDAHVRTGRKDRKPWQDHVTYFRGLIEYLKNVPFHKLIVVGDFNQRIPRSTASKEARGMLTELVGIGLSLPTSGLRGDDGKLGVDHIAVGADILVRSVGTIDNSAGEVSLSDHFGVTVVLAESAHGHEG